jgi:hypothetical protein
MVFAADFGVVLSGQAQAENYGETDISAKATLAPWFSLASGTTDFYVSAGASADYSDAYTDKILFIPELFRLELSLKPAPGFGLKVGRFAWQDISRFTARGTFDGADLRFDLEHVTLGVSGFYTGFLYKNTADININAASGDPKNYGAEFDFADFSETYFAPRRAIASVYGEFPGALLERGALYAGLLAQFDISNAEEPFHTQYLLLRYTFMYNRFDAALGAALQLENTNAEGLRLAYAFSVEGGWELRLPLFVKDRLSLGARYASGEGPSTAAFFPVTREPQGTAITHAFSGIMVIRANYEARIVSPFSAALGARYFIRTDSVSFTDPYKDNYLENDSHLLGAEIDASLLWVPVSDLSFSLAGGIFLPQTGQAFASGAPLIWSVSLGTVVSF